LLREAEHERQLLQLSLPNARMPFVAPLMSSLRPLSSKLRKGFQHQSGQRMPDLKLRKGMVERQKHEG